MEEFKSNIQRIKNLEIQGASNVAIFGLESLNQYIKTLKSKSKDGFFNKINSASQLLIEVRPTEPCLRNGIQYVIKNSINIESNSISELKSKIDKSIEDYQNLLLSANEKIAEYGAKRIPDGSTILTHCHSSVVIEIFRKAYNEGKKIKVIATETRPMYQGHRTIHELSDIIDTTMIIDSAMRWAVRNKSVDLILVGADSITVEGTILNKIGSRLLALVAQENHIPFYVAATMLKYDPKSIFGTLEVIEMRDEKEIWKNAPLNIEILNPAFEPVPSNLISALITEIGIFPSVLISEKFENHYPFLI